MDVSPLSPVNPTPVATATPPTEQQVAENRRIVTAVKALNESAFLGDNNELTFGLDRETQRPIIQIIDRHTREVIDQIPPEYVLRIAEDLRLG